MPLVLSGSHCPQALQLPQQHAFTFKQLSNRQVPFKLLEVGRWGGRWLRAGRRGRGHTCTYGQWRAGHPSPRRTSCHVSSCRTSSATLPTPLPHAISEHALVSVAPLSAKVASAAHAALGVSALPQCRSRLSGVPPRCASCTMQPHSRKPSVACVVVASLALHAKTQQAVWSRCDVCHQEHHPRDT